MTKLKFEIQKKCTSSLARVGKMTTQHSEIDTPVFMPVGTRGCVKMLTHQQVEDLGAQIILGNTYHLMLKPGKEIIKKAGGLHKFSSWKRSLLTDSGGFQVFSLSKLNKITAEGVHFKSHIDGSKHFLGPDESMEIQKVLGSDIVMAFDECPPYPCSFEEIQKSWKLSKKWAERCRDYKLQDHQSLFGIVQGGVYKDLREESIKDLVKIGFEGYAIGGLSVGEPAEEMYKTLDFLSPHMPEDKPRYLMGVGTPRNIVEAVMRGIDMFDCVMPTRNARNGTAFTWQGKINIKSGRFSDDHSPLDPELDNYASKLSKSYIRHLLNVDEATGASLVTMQNLAFYLDFMRCLRQAITDNDLENFYQKTIELYPK
jgi:queuine tRNA-ribosyltransferase